MIDIVDRKTRSRMMSGIRAKNTRPELLVRRGLFALGYRYRLHCKSLPGRPDIVMSRHRVAILIHGCFWHGHAGCPYFRFPASNPEFWRRKLLGNAERDLQHAEALINRGWRVAVVWECALRNDPDGAIRRLERFVLDRRKRVEIGYRPALRPAVKQ